MNKIKSIENQAKNLHLQIIVDIAIILLISVVALSIYNDYWVFEHSSKENMVAIHFDMFSFYYTLVFVLIMSVLPKAFEFFSVKNFLHEYILEKQLPTRLVRTLKIIIVTVIIVLCSIIFADKYSRVEFYNNGRIVEYNKNNVVVNEYERSNVDSVEIRTNHNFGRRVDYWIEAVINIGDNYYILKSDNYIVHDDFVVNPETERSLYGLKKVKEIFSDKIKINTENLDVLFEVERYEYTQSQAKELCEIFEVDFDEMMLWLKEDEGIVLEKDM